MAQAFIDNPLQYRDVIHKDGNKQNNVITNLEWVSSEERVCKNDVTKKHYKSLKKLGYFNVPSIEYQECDEQGFVSFMHYFHKLPPGDAMAHKIEHYISHMLPRLKLK